MGRKNVVSAGLADRAEIQLAYAIGHPEPTSVTLDCFGTERGKKVRLKKRSKRSFHLNQPTLLTS